jgi:hypothetical protein
MRIMFSSPSAMRVGGGEIKKCELEMERATPRQAANA